jgi:hypothetical protein
MHSATRQNPASRAMRAKPRLLRHREEDEQAHRQGERDDAAEHLAPVQHAQQNLERHGDRQRAEHAARKGHAVHRGDALGRIPEREGGKRRHQAARDAQAHEGARRGELGRRATEREPRAAGGGNEQQRRIHAPRTIAIQQDAEGKLEEREGEEVDAGEEAQTRGAQAQLARDVRPDDRVDRAVDVGNEVPRQERQGDAQEDYFFSRPPR